MEFWSTGVLRIVGIAPRVRGVGGAFSALLAIYPGLKHWAKFFCPFGACPMRYSSLQYRITPVLRFLPTSRAVSEDDDYPILNNRSRSRLYGFRTRHNRHPDDRLA
jgi:hypothetical protein